VGSAACKTTQEDFALKKTTQEDGAITTIMLATSNIIFLSHQINTSHQPLTSQ